eukprot:gene16949-20137_t
MIADISNFETFEVLGALRPTRPRAGGKVASMSLEGEAPNKPEPTLDKFERVNDPEASVAEPSEDLDQAETPQETETETLQETETETLQETEAEGPQKIDTEALPEAESEALQETEAAEVSDPGWSSASGEEEVPETAESATEEATALSEDAEQQPSPLSLAQGDEEGPTTEEDVAVSEEGSALDVPATSPDQGDGLEDGTTETLSSEDIPAEQAIEEEETTAESSPADGLSVEEPGNEQVEEEGVGEGTSAEPDNSEEGGEDAAGATEEGSAEEVVEPEIFQKIQIFTSSAAEDSAGSEEAAAGAETKDELELSAEEAEPAEGTLVEPEEAAAASYVESSIPEEPNDTVTIREKYQGSVRCAQAFAGPAEETTGSAKYAGSMTYEVAKITSNLSTANARVNAGNDSLSSELAPLTPECKALLDNDNQEDDSWRQETAVAFWFGAGNDLQETAVAFWFGAGNDLQETAVAFWFGAGNDLQETEVAFWFGAENDLQEAAVAFWFGAGNDLQETAVAFWFEVGNDLQETAVIPMYDRSFERMKGFVLCGLPLAIAKYDHEDNLLQGKEYAVYKHTGNRHPIPLRPFESAFQMLRIDLLDSLSHKEENYFYAMPIPPCMESYNSESSEPWAGGSLSRLVTLLGPVEQQSHGVTYSTLWTHRNYEQAETFFEGLLTGPDVDRVNVFAYE